MKTAEEIAGAVLDARMRLNGYGDWTTNMVESAVLAAAREAQREVMESVSVIAQDNLCGARAVGGPCTMPGAHNMGRADVPSNHHHSDEPQFAPEGEPDEYREAFESLYNPNDDWQPLWLLRVTGPTGVKTFDVPRDQVRHILAYLSEQNRKDDE